MFDTVKMNEWARRNPATLSRRIEELEAINAEMLEALEDLLEETLEPTNALALALSLSNAQSVIAKAKGEQP